MIQLGSDAWAGIACYGKHMHHDFLAPKAYLHSMQYILK